MTLAQLSALIDPVTNAEPEQGNIVELAALAAMRAG